MLEEMADGQMLTGLLISSSGSPSPTRLPWALPSSAVFGPFFGRHQGGQVALGVQGGEEGREPR